jgi:hypothetical protein
LPSRTALDGAGRFGISDEVGVDQIADSPFEGPDGFLARLPFGPFAFVIGAARTVSEVALSDPSHVNGVVEPAVASPGEPVDLLLPGGHLDGGGAVVGGKGSSAGEAADVTDRAHHCAGHERADPNTSVTVVPEALTARVM